MPFDLDTAKPVVSGGFDLSSALPAGAKPHAPPVDIAEPEKPPEINATNILGAGLEPAMAMATGALAQPVSGLIGLGAMAVNPILEKFGLKTTPAGTLVRNVGSAMTYQPRTAGGRAALNTLSYPFQKLEQGADWAGQKMANVKGPYAPAANVMGAGVNTAIQAIPQLLLGRLGATNLPVRGELTAPPNVQMLANRGITMTPGQIMQGRSGVGPRMVSRMEQAAQSIPGPGDVIKGARSRAVRDFHTMYLNEALQIVGEQLPKGATGRAAVSKAYAILDEKWKTLLPKMKGDLELSPQGNLLPPPGGARTPKFIDEIEKVRQMGKNLPRQQQRDLNRIINDEILGKFNKAGLAPGETVKAIGEILKKEAANFKRGGPYERNLGDAISELNASMNRMLQRQNPQFATQLRELESAYGKYKNAEKAAEMTKDGVFSPSVLDRAIRIRSQNKGKFARGEQRDQALAEAGSSVLGDTLADSGTPYRIALMEALAGGGALAGHPMGAALLAGLPALYSRPALRGMQSMLMRPPNVGHAAARAAPIGALEQAQQGQ